MSKYKLIIEKDDFPEDPRNWGNVGEMICFHNSYKLGDKHNYLYPSEFIYELSHSLLTEIFIYDEGTCVVDPLECMFTVKEMKEIIANNYIILPVYLYDHSGLTISTKKFSCQWDSMQVGWIFAPIGFEGMSEYQIKNHLIEEVKTYDYFLQGEVYQYTLYEKKVSYYDKVFKNENGEYTGEKEEVAEEEWVEIDSCSGFYGENIVEGILKYNIPKEVVNDLQVCIM